MAQPGNVTYRLIQVTDSAGAGVAGLTLASFTVIAKSRGYGAAGWTNFTPGSILVDLTGGYYSLEFTLPAAAGWWRYMILHATNRVWNGSWEGELEINDWDSVYASGVRPVVLPTTTAYLGQSITGSELVAYRWNTWSIPVKDTAGANVDLTLYNNLLLSVRSKDQTTKKLDASNGGPTGFILTGAVGLLTVTWPETLGTVGTAPDIYSWIGAGQLSGDIQPLYFEVTGDYNALAAQTVPIIRSSELRITRREVGT